MFKNNLVGKPWKEEESSKNTVAEANVPEKNFEMKTYVIVHYWILGKSLTSRVY